MNVRGAKRADRAADDFLPAQLAGEREPVAVSSSPMTTLTPF